ncbi:hypothetical protein [Kribbella deserti]|uniref:Peptidase MA-like domain-containing protein n=1 Tax=Kribbella deserti TaxID=1926257 RepID=A0ABV6QN42_9ACTN
MSVKPPMADTSGGPSKTTTAAHGPRRWIGLVAAVALAGGGVVYAVHDRGDAPPTTTATQRRTQAPSAAQLAETARRTAIDAILARRAAAVQRGDEKAFLQDIDPSEVGLRRAQQTLFANLVELGFRRLEYLQAEERFDQVVIKNHGPSAYLVRIVMRYQIADVDAVPVSTELGYTFARRANRWYLVDDNDLDLDLGPSAHREPWDLGRIEVHRGPRVRVVVEKGDTKRARLIVAEAKEALAEVGKYWPLPWTGTVLVVALDETEVRDARFADEDIESAASATSTFAEMPGEVTAEGKIGGAYVVVNPAERDRVDEILLSHEFTHVATARLGGYEPLWLAEGAAEYVSWSGVEAVSGPNEVLEWEADVIRDAMPALQSLPTDAGFYDKSGDVYGVSWLAVRFLIKEVGIEKVAQLYTEIARDGINQISRDRILTAQTGYTEASLWLALKKYQPER